MTRSSHRRVLGVQFVIRMQAQLRVSPRLAPRPPLKGSVVVGGANDSSES